MKTKTKMRMVMIFNLEGGVQEGPRVLGGKGRERKVWADLNVNANANVDVDVDVGR